MVQYAGTTRNSSSKAATVTSASNSTPSTTGVLTFTQLEQLWIRNGGNPSWAPFMAAVAQAESGGRVNAFNTNPTTGDTSVGLWQINFYGPLTSSRTAAYGPKTLLRRTPTANAMAAVSIFGTGANVNAWPDSFVQAWAASGAPVKPSTGVVQSIQARIRTLTGTGGNILTSGSTTAATTAASKTTQSTTQTLLGIGPFKFLTRRQARELIGGLLVFGGVIVMGVGIYVIVRTSSPVSAARAGIKAARGDVTGAAKTVRKSQKKRAAKKAEQEEQGS